MSSSDRMRSFVAAGVLATLVIASPAAAQQRPLETQDPEPIGAGLLLLQAGVTASHDAVYPLSGLAGDLWQAPLLGATVGLSSIADLQISGGPYDRLEIGSRSPAPLAAIVTATGDVTHDVDDIVMGTKVRFVSESDGTPAMAFHFSVRLPNAKHHSGLGQDTTDFSAMLLGGKTLGPLRVAANFGLAIVSEPLDAMKQNDEPTYGLSLACTVAPALAFVGEINGRADTRKGPAPLGTESRSTVRFGIRIGTGATSVDVAAGVGLTPFTPRTSATVGVTHVFRLFAPHP